MYGHRTLSAEQFTIVHFLVTGGLGYLTMLFSESDLYFKFNGIFAKPTYLVICFRHRIIKVMYQEVSEIVLIVASK